MEENINKWNSKLKIILDKEKNYPNIQQLYVKIKEFLHGNTEIDFEKTKGKIIELCNNHQFDCSNMQSINIYKPTWTSNETYIYMDIYITGKFNGIMHIQSSSGYTTKNGYRQDIYYIGDYDCYIRSELSRRIKDHYLNYRDEIFDVFVDLLFDKDCYLKYDCQYNRYELWDNEPERYSDTLAGKSYDDYLKYDNYNLSYKKYKNLKVLIKSNSISKFAEEKLYGSKESIEWTNYKL